MCAVWIGLPCNSWSRARHDINGGGPRSKEHIFGIPNLSPADSLRVALGNNTLYFACSIIRLCKKFGAPICLENPATSLVWQVPALDVLNKSSTISVSDFCQYDKPWRKRTKVATWNILPDLCPSLKCTGRSGICSRTNVAHIQLTGHHPTAHMPWTKFAEPYPNSWAKSWSAAIESSLVERWLTRDNRLIS